MGVNTFDVMDLGRVGLLNPEQMGYKDSIDIIKDESVKIQKSFVKIGWYLKHIRDNELYKEEGYLNIWECAADQLGYSQSTASRFINICEKFSKGHNSPELDEKYVGFDKSQMIEMLPMQEKQLEKVTPDMTVKQIRDIKNEKSAVQEVSVPREEREKTSKIEALEESVEEVENIPGQTSIEEDFPKFLPDTYATSHEETHSAKDEESFIDREGKKCITGFSRYGVCSCCGYEGVRCCSECKEDSCNSRCGWLSDPYKSTATGKDEKELMEDSDHGLSPSKDNIDQEEKKDIIIDIGSLDMAKYILKQEKAVLDDYLKMNDSIAQMRLLRQKILVFALETLINDLEKN